jgi:hypothetical protein
MHAYNLFRRKRKQDFYCAVPEDRAVPAFLHADNWEFDRRVEETAGAPFGFDARAAQEGSRFIGFYLFQAV